MSSNGDKETTFRTWAMIIVAVLGVVGIVAHEMLSVPTSVVSHDPKPPPQDDTRPLPPPSNDESKQSSKPGGLNQVPPHSSDMGSCPLTGDWYWTEVPPGGTSGTTDKAKFENSLLIIERPSIEIRYSCSKQGDIMTLGGQIAEQNGTSLDMSKLGIQSGPSTLRLLDDGRYSGRWNGSTFYLKQR